MRVKELQCVITFHATTEAMAFEDSAKAAGFNGRLIPVPTSITAGCGLAWKDAPENKETLLRFIKEQGLAFEAIHELVI
ncbi:DUF3343 domain-containing protein [Youngiibacter fragilis]|uniref:Putative Se/S carrier protein-like domain-containing protein n=1 Tax=Youngiibacter fragilis 232.1 TaxID=994573 RepID=V7I1L9_9CLOT|nr:DUF3343 domain-containing protein [Youngiibacter fragilis]ETA80125.1 hypothetical protein T472_0213525 [Youngiibacter fragilis 232.1]